ncbi:six-bladed beta-propeller, TolB-like protein [Artemisia annua]|uniref:Six-bladed beta-propeller, TolB-like protein n=1 Tax=Artemisia annua TaxID=35608 RepID=A0A2U1PQ66_ARTAN|nr:six-bladed beta-propeller, TolB-like protein [Artemisia annua]
MWATIETTENSGNFISFSIYFRCAHDSPLQCGFKLGVKNVPDLGYVISFSEDNNKDVYLLASSGL